jgi:hypothetical protein
MRRANGDRGSGAPSVFVRLAPAKPTAVFESYWALAAERQNVFFRRFRSEPEPWTQDPILQAFKFTNAYRASDRVSQYLIRHVIYRDDLPRSPPEVIFRILLFKLFNRTETWELLERAHGPLLGSEFAPRLWGKTLEAAFRRGEAVYSAAYIMPPARRFGYKRKHSNHLALLERMMRDGIAERLLDANSMQEAYSILLGYPYIGTFLAYQFATDLNYSPVMNFSEMDFVVPGPGARSGLAKCFTDLGGLSEEEMIRLVADRQESEFEARGIPFQSLWGRRLQLIDCQNLFCEVDKYARVMHPQIRGHSDRSRIKQSFSPSSARLPYWYPPKWGINGAVRNGLRQ